MSDTSLTHVDGTTTAVTLAVEELTVDYVSTAGESFRALDGINLAIDAGEFVTVIGPSGCGKSTLLLCLGGLLAPSQGRVMFRNEPISGPEPTRAAFVFQDYSLLPWKTALGNAALGLRFGGVSKAVRHRRAQECLDLMELGAVADAYPGELSGGMQQRVAVARALAMDPEVLLLDEPFGALDEQSRRHLGVEMAGLLNQTGKTLVLITHSLDEAIFWGDRVVVMGPSPGRVIDEIRVEEPRPRDLDFMMTTTFGEIRTRLLDLTRRA